MIKQLIKLSHDEISLEQCGLPNLFFETNLTTKLTSFSAPWYGLSAITLAESGANFIDTQGAKRSLFQKWVTLPLSTTDILIYICPFKASCSCIVCNEHLRRCRDSVSFSLPSSFLSVFSWHSDNSTWPFLFSFYNNNNGKLFSINMSLLQNLGTISI